MIVSTTAQVPERKVNQILGLVTGASYRTLAVSESFKPLGQGVSGGEIPIYSELLEKTQKEAHDRMVAKAQALGADAILNVRISNTTISNVGGAEMIIYGTAVRFG